MNYFKKLVKFLLYNLSHYLAFKPGVRILLYHDIKPFNREQFKKQIYHLSKNYNIIHPNEYLKALSSKSHYLMLTFDDGFISNYDVLDILAEVDIKAIFFVNQSFILGDRSKFKNLLLGDDFEKSNFMSEIELKKLSEKGHLIGSHSYSHLNFSKLDSAKMIHEVKNNQIYLEHLLDQKINHFAYPFGELQHINNEAIRIIKGYHKFIYSGIRGINTLQNQRLIFRDSIEPSMSLKEVDAIIKGVFDFFYLKKQKKYLSFIDE